MRRGAHQTQQLSGLAEKGVIIMKEVAMIRLIADEGKVLTNGTVQGKVIDVCPVEDKSKWTEIDEPETVEE